MIPTNNLQMVHDIPRQVHISNFLKFLLLQINQVMTFLPDMLRRCIYRQELKRSLVGWTQTPSVRRIPVPAGLMFDNDIRL